MKFLWRIALRKGVVSGVSAAVALIGLSTLKHWGIQVDQAALASAAIGALATLRNYLKVKRGLNLP